MSERYGDHDYWNERYELSDSPFDWMCSYDDLASTLRALLPGADTMPSILVVGCGDAPFSVDLVLDGFRNTLNVDYSEVVIEKQKIRYPWLEKHFKVMDCLNMNEIEDDTFDVVIDKSLIDTSMCYENGYDTTMKLYCELCRVLKPGGRLITISLHREIEVLPFGCGNPACSFVASSCTLASTRKNDTCHSLCVFDKLDGCDVGMAAFLSSQHPIEFINAREYSKHDWQRWGREGPVTSDFIDELLLSFNNALEVL